MAFGRNLMIALFDRKMTQTQLAEKIGVTQAAVNYYISEKRTPTLELCVKIADVLGMSLDELVRDSSK